MLSVVNKRRHRRTAADVYIGRPSALGNPFVIGPDGSRADVVRKYEEYVRARPDLMNLIGTLRGRDANLVCWCAPLACHGDVIKRICEEVA